MGQIFLNSYKPLCATKIGREAIENYKQLPFVDASNRREPNLEGDFGSISSLCRRGLLISKLNLGDKVVYITKKGRYKEGIADRHWCLTTIFEIINECSTHKEAAEWFKQKNIIIPSNCIVEGNLPLDNILTGYKCFDEERYRRRATEFPTYYICRKLFIELKLPSVITERDFNSIFGKIQGKQNPRKITEEQYKELIKVCKIKI